MVQFKINNLYIAPTVTTITLPPLVQENVIIRPVTCSGTEDQLRDCLRGHDITITDSAMVAGLNCSMLIPNTTTVLAAITGVLVVALIAVVTAWIITCVHAKRFVTP